VTSILRQVPRMSQKARLERSRDRALGDQGQMEATQACGNPGRRQAGRWAQEGRAATGEPAARASCERLADVAILANATHALIFQNSLMESNLIQLLHAP
jgi:hypothetical protein